MDTLDIGYTVSSFDAIASFVFSLQSQLSIIKVISFLNLLIPNYFKYI